MELKDIEKKSQELWTWLETSEDKSEFTHKFFGIVDLYKSFVIRGSNDAVAAMFQFYKKYLVCYMKADEDREETISRFSRTFMFSLEVYMGSADMPPTLDTEILEACRLGHLRDINDQLITIATAYRNEKHYQRAIRFYEAAGLDFDDEYRWSNYAQCYCAIKQPKKALKIYQNAIKKIPSNITLLNEAANIYVQLKNYDIALKIIDKVVLLAEHDKYSSDIKYFNALYSKAECLKAMDKPLERYFQYALMLSAGNEDSSKWALKQAEGLKGAIK